MNTAYQRVISRISSGRKSFIADIFGKVSYLTATHMLSGVLVLATTAVLANRLGPELYGEFSFVDSVLFISILVASLGTEYIGNREVARNEKSEEIVNGILLLRTGASLAVYAALNAWALLFVESHTLKALLLISSSVMLSVPGIAGWYFLARHQIRTVAVATILRDVLFFLSVLLLLDSPADGATRLIYAGAFYSLSRFVFSGVFLIKIFRSHRFSLRVRLSTYKEIMKDSFVLLYASLLSSVMINMQIYVLKYFGRVHELGIYGAFFKQIFYIQLMSVSFVVIFFPLLSRAWQEDREKYSRLASILTEITFFLIVPVALSGILNAEWLIETVFSDEYMAGALTLKLLCVSLVPMSFGRVLTTGLFITMDKTSKMFVLVNTTFVFSLAASYLFIGYLPRPDVSAAASKLLTEFLFVGIAYVIVARTLKIMDSRMLICMVPASTGMLAVKALTPGVPQILNITGGLAAFAVIYLVILYRWRYDDLRDMLRLEN